MRRAAHTQRVRHVLPPDVAPVNGSNGGGDLLAAVHTIMNGVPPENVVAMADAAVEFGTYPVRG